jgi:hypothetical protein
VLGRGAFSFVLAVQRRSSGRAFAAKYAPRPLLRAARAAPLTAARASQPQPNTRRCVHTQGMGRGERRDALRSALAEAAVLSRLRHPVRLRGRGACAHFWWQHCCC